MCNVQTLHTHMVNASLLRVTGLEQNAVMFRVWLRDSVVVASVTKVV